MEKERAATDKFQDKQCRSWGAKHGSTDYIHCRETLYSQDAQQKQTAAILSGRQPVRQP
jgi:hypothetical protein